MQRKYHFTQQLIQPYKDIAIYGAGAHGNTIATFLNQENLQNIKRSIHELLWIPTSSILFRILLILLYHHTFYEIS